MPRNLTRGSNQSPPQAVRPSENVSLQPFLNPVRVVGACKALISQPWENVKAKQERHKLAFVGSIVVTHDYSWGPSTVTAHYWSRANKANYTQEETESKVWCWS